MPEVIRYISKRRAGSQHADGKGVPGCVKLTGWKMCCNDVGKRSYAYSLPAGPVAAVTNPDRRVGWNGLQLLPKSTMQVVQEDRAGFRVQQVMHHLIAFCFERQMKAQVRASALHLHMLAAQPGDLAGSSTGIQCDRKQGIIAQALGGGTVDV